MTFRTDSISRNKKIIYSDKNLSTHNFTDDKELFVQAISNQELERNRNLTQQSSTPEKAQHTQVARVYGKNRPTETLGDLRKSLDSMLQNDKRLNNYLDGKIPASEARSSRESLRATFDDFVAKAKAEKPSALSDFYKDHKDKFPSIVKASTTGTGAGYDLPVLVNATKAHAKGQMSDNTYRDAIHQAQVNEKYNTSDKRLSTIASKQNLDQLKETHRPNLSLASKSEEASVNVRVGKLATVELSSRVNTYRYPSGAGQIELSGSIKGIGGPAIEVNVSGPYKGKVGPNNQKDETYMFAEWIGGAGLEGGYTAKIQVPNKDGVPGWKRAENFLDKVSTGRFVPWKLLSAARKEFGNDHPNNNTPDGSKSPVTGSTTKAGGYITTKLYGSTALLDDANLSKAPEGLRTRASEIKKSLLKQSARAYGEGSAAFSLKYIQNYNNPETSVLTEHTDAENVQTTNYYGLKLKYGVGAKGVIGVGGFAKGGGGSYTKSYSFGVTDNYDTSLWTTEKEYRVYKPQSFFDGRVNGWKDKPLNSSKQVTSEVSGETVLKLREREIRSWQTARELAHSVNTREWRNKPMQDRLNLIQNHLPKGVDIRFEGDAYKNLKKVTGRTLDKKNWDTFIAGQLNGNKGNYLTTRIKNWRIDNGIDALDKAYQKHWPATRDKYEAQTRQKLDKADFAEISAYLKSRHTLTPQTTVYTILQGEAHKQQYSGGQSFPDKPDAEKPKAYSGLWKKVVSLETEQHKRLGLFTVTDKTRQTAFKKIFSSIDRTLNNAFLDIYNSERYPTVDKSGTSHNLRPIYSGDPRHIMKLNKMTGKRPDYGPSVYVVKEGDVKPGESTRKTLGRIFENGMEQLTEAGRFPPEVNQNSRSYHQRREMLINRFVSVNFPGANDAEVMERLQTGVPLMLIDVRYDL